MLSFLSIDSFSMEMLFFPALHLPYRICTSIRWILQVFLEAEYILFNMTGMERRERVIGILFSSFLMLYNRFFNLFVPPSSIHLSPRTKDEQLGITINIILLLPQLQWKRTGWPGQLNIHSITMSIVPFFNHGAFHTRRLHCGWLLCHLIYLNVNCSPLFFW